MRVNTTIMQKVAEKEQYEKDLDRCLSACICPNCGAGLNWHQDEDDVVVHTCAKCGWRHSN